jgi:hypothetical protein
MPLPVPVPEIEDGEKPSSSKIARGKENTPSIIAGHGHGHGHQKNAGTAEPFGVHGSQQSRCRGFILK